MNNHAAIPNAEIDGEIATVLDDAIRLPEIQPEHQHDSLIPTSDLKAKHELEHSPDGVGRMRRSCAGGAGCGTCGCGCGCGCCQKSCCSSTCTTCTTVTTCCKTCCQQCCQSSCCGCSGCNGGSCNGHGCGNSHRRKKRDIMELLGGRLLREKRSPKSSRRRANDRIPVKKTIKVSIDVVNF
ncbi:hypothetical protein LOAG_08067 [Loa loa]|uniref:Uncharacterized protein n=1 Tax=Loa loa TaxID=7209 RepID=A0A1S0TUQ6_LOALO|nr:hypothetical protein LOAG_08067 [Loa loa]EFO20425.1 hypothetical protein LOAG_08067 [Loa loa]